MHPFTKLLLVLALVVLVFWLVTKFRERQAPEGTMAPVPVSDLPPGVQESVDHALSNGQTINAIKIYRDATNASLTQAKQAIDVRTWQLKP
jgi:ribosomal protein L7/L12